MTHTAVIIKTHTNAWNKDTKVTRHVLVCDTEKELFTKIFKEHDNRHKYNNYVVAEIEDPKTRAAYNTWIRDINNYAEAGGDMW